MPVSQYTTDSYYSSYSGVLNCKCLFNSLLSLSHGKSIVSSQKVSTECRLLLPVSYLSVSSLPKRHAAAAYVFFLFFLSFLSFLQ
jgi:hypothetical protein